MSEPLLKAIVKLFAIVAKEDAVTEQERNQIEAFLNDHLNKKSVEKYLNEFDSYCETIINVNDLEEERKRIGDLCSEINRELTQKQKIVIILELVGIILADGHISDREQELVKSIGQSFNISENEIELIETFVTGREPNEFDHPEVLIIDGSEKKLKSVKHLTREGMSGFIALLHLVKADAYFLKYFGSENVYLNGVALKKEKIAVFATGSTIRVDKINPIYFGDVVAQFITRSDNQSGTFEANNISFRFKNGKLGLRDVSIVEESGKLIGLMGASGAGKSTLLNVLNGTETPTGGSVLINGIDIHKNPDKVEGVIGFVPQDDLLIEELTVYQNLYYAARLCFDQLSKDEVETLVVKTLDNLGLSETRDLKVGSPLEKTISGGQRKRLNIGLELLREPSVLFVDEPTSGLSSRDSENIMDLLKELSLKGKLIFVVIHQPSSDIFKMFDKLVILDTGGYQIYYGNPVEAVVYFKETINLINSDEGECHECGNVNPEQIFNIIETRVVNEYGNFTNERKISPEDWNQFYKNKIDVVSIKTSTDPPHSTLNIPNKLKQLKLFAARDVLSKLSNKQYLLINLLEAPVLAFILSYIVRYYNTHSTVDSGYSFSQNINIPAYFLMSIIVALFMGLTVSAEEIIRDRKILKREAFLHLSRSSYILSKIFILFSLSAIQTISFVVVGNSILQIHDMLFEHWMILFTTSCMANAMGLNISSAFNSAVTIYILIPILLIPQLVLSGVVVKFDKLNPDLSKTGKVPVVGDLMASRWALEAAMVSQFRDNEYEETFYTYEQVMAEADYKKIYYLPTVESKLQFALNNLNNKDESVQREIADGLTLVCNEIREELEKIGADKFPEVDQLTIDKFDSALYNKTFAFLEMLRGYYSNRYNKADRAKEKMVIEMTNDPEKKKEFEKFKARYRNEAIAEIVTNKNEQHRIVEAENELVQLIFPIYKNPEPDHILDYREPFYAPKKHIFGYIMNTLHFNLLVIWIMTLILCVTLYYDILRKLVDTSEKLTRKIKRNSR
ncbi:MAG: ATP-binding cassette domain-containing protein [Bacteroidota bacterium]